MSNKQVLVYVHGVCKLTRGYSDPWWAALSPFAASLQDGDLGEPGETTSKRYEVFWSDLCILETVTPQPPGMIANLFLVGSALSISPVRTRLIDVARDGHRPRMVRRWINLDAKGDFVGGPLRVVSFGVDQEFLNLPPVDCNPSHPDPACAHRSYFDAQNLATNRDIFGRFIAT